MSLGPSLPRLLWHSTSFPVMTVPVYKLLHSVRVFGVPPLMRLHDRSVLANEASSL